VQVDLLAPGNNEYYQPLLLRELPRPCRRVLDVGCGTGRFAATLTRYADEVDAIDRSETMIRAARRRVPEGVRWIEGDVLLHPLPEAHYDAVTSIAALHHMPLEAVLPRLAAALRPGGVLVATALPGLDLRHLPVEGVAVAANVGRRALLRALPSAWLPPAGEPVPEDADMPMTDGSLTVRQVRAVARDLLPGARVRRLLLWRYLLVWRKPSA
jgi:SAM-dependent methyltransferase